MATTFDDGIVQVARLQNTAAPGDRPRREYTVIAEMAFSYLHVGVTRHYESMRAGENILYLIEMYQLPEVKVNDVAIIDRTRYRIQRVTHTFNSDGIRVTQLTLGDDPDDR